MELHNEVPPLQNIIQHHNLSLHAPAAPTHISNVPNKHSFIIDFLISKNPPYPIITNITFPDINNSNYIDSAVDLLISHINDAQNLLFLYLKPLLID